MSVCMRGKLIIIGGWVGKKTQHSPGAEREYSQLLCPGKIQRHIKIVVTDSLKNCLNSIPGSRYTREQTQMAVPPFVKHVHNADPSFFRVNRFSGR